MSSSITPTSPVRKKPINPIRNKPANKSPVRSASRKAHGAAAATSSFHKPLQSQQEEDAAIASSPLSIDGQDHNNSNNQRQVHDLTEQLNQASAKHSEELYWMNLELDTMRQENQQLQDRMTELSKDLATVSDDRPRPCPTTPTHVQDLLQNLEKQEKMVRTLHNQVALLRSSGDAMVKTYKDQLAALMTDKTQSQVQWTNQIAELEKERDHLRVRLQAAEQGQRSKEVAVADGNANEKRQHHGATSEEVKRLQTELHRYKKDSLKLQNELLAEKRNAKSAVDQVTQDRKDLSRQIESLQTEMAHLRSTSVTAEMIEQIQQDREDAIETLEHVAAVWEKADSSIQKLDGVIQRLTPDDSRQSTDEQEQLLSTAETAALIHSQIKVSLMLIELKLRNNLTCLQNDKIYMGIKADDEALLERLDTIQDDAMTAIEQVQAILDEELVRLEEDARGDENDEDDDETGYMRDDSGRHRPSYHTSRRSTDRQSHLQDRISEFIEDESNLSREEIGDDGTVQQYISTKFTEKLQDEVSQIFDSLQERNAEIVRLKSTVDELTVRERSLMHELRRCMAEQAKIEAAERQRRMDAMKALDTDDDDDEPTTEDDDDDGGSGFASSVEFSVEEADYDEVTYYEEVSVA